MSGPDQPLRSGDDPARHAPSPPPTDGSVSVETAARLCDIGQRSVRVLVDRGLLRLQDGHVEKDSLIDLQRQLERLRALASDPVAARVLAEEIADGVLLRDPSIADGLRAMHRGEYTVVD